MNIILAGFVLSVHCQCIYNTCVLYLCWTSIQFTWICL